MHNNYRSSEWSVFHLHLSSTNWRVAIIKIIVIDISWWNKYVGWRTSSMSMPRLCTKILRNILSRKRNSNEYWQRLKNCIVDLQSGYNLLVQGHAIIRIFPFMNHTMIAEVMTDAYDVSLRRMVTSRIGVTPCTGPTYMSRFKMSNIRNERGALNCCPRRAAGQKIDVRAVALQRRQKKTNRNASPQKK